MMRRRPPSRKGRRDASSSSVFDDEVPVKLPTNPDDIDGSKSKVDVNTDIKITTKSEAAINKKDNKAVDTEPIKPKTSGKATSVDIFSDVDSPVNNPKPVVKSIEKDTKKEATNLGLKIESL